MKILCNGLNLRMEMTKELMKWKRPIKTIQSEEEEKNDKKSKYTFVTSRMLLSSAIYM